MQNFDQEEHLQCHLVESSVDPDPTMPPLISPCQEKYQTARLVCEENETSCTFDVELVNVSTCQQYCADHGGECFEVSGKYSDYCKIANADHHACDEGANDIVCVCTM